MCLCDRFFVCRHAVYGECGELAASLMTVGNAVATAGYFHGVQQGCRHWIVFVHVFLCVCALVLFLFLSSWGGGAWTRERVQYYSRRVYRQWGDGNAVG